MKITQKTPNVSLYQGTGADDALQQAKNQAVNNGRKTATSTSWLTPDQVRVFFAQGEPQHAFLFSADMATVANAMPLAAEQPATHFHISAP